jgi:SAM-dependent methyltransferase
MTTANTGVSGIRAAWRLTFGWQRREAVRRWIVQTFPSRFLYGRAFYERHDRYVESSMRPMAETLHSLCKPLSVVDAGCGNGWLLHFLHQLGVKDLLGLEYSSYGISATQKRGLTANFLDMTKPFSPPRTFELCCCFEVAEHVPPQFADNVVDILTNLAPTVAFSAATPGQGGTDHVNEQPLSYWVAKFQQRGFALDSSTTTSLQEAWSRDPGIAHYYAANVMLFRQSAS